MVFKMLDECNWIIKYLKFKKLCFEKFCKDGAGVYKYSPNFLADFRNISPSTWTTKSTSKLHHANIKWEKYKNQQNKEYIWKTNSNRIIKFNNFEWNGMKRIKYYRKLYGTVKSVSLWIGNRWNGGVWNGQFLHYLSTSLAPKKTAIFNLFYSGVMERFSCQANIFYFSMENCNNKKMENLI
jgi:hypothetical protein